MSARHVEDLLARYCEGALPAPEAREIEVHLEGCAGCRVAESEVRRGLALARALEPGQLPAASAARIRRALAEAPPAPSTRHGLRFAAAAAAVVLLAILRFPAHAPETTATPAPPRPGPGGLILEPDPGEPTAFERTALDLHAAHADGRLSLDLHSSSVPDVRQWAEDNAGLSVNLAVTRPAEDGERYAVEGVRKVLIGGATALAVAYRVDGQPVTLLTARAEDTPDRAREWTPGGKRVRFRTAGRHKLLAWTNSGQAYALVSDLAGHGQQSCLLCHTSAERRETIRALGQPAPYPRRSSTAGPRE